MRNIKIKSYSKINLYLNVVKKLNSGYHNLTSLITFCEIHDMISVAKNFGLRDKISFSGKFKIGINKKKNTVTKLLNFLRKEKLIGEQTYKINVKKNIPHGSGLGGGSSNAAALLNFFNRKMKLELNNKKMFKIANKIGFDVPISLKKNNTFLTGKKNKILRIGQSFRLNLLIVYPNLTCSTKKIYGTNSKVSAIKSLPIYRIKDNKKLIKFLKNQNNDLEEAVLKTYPKIKKIINYIKSQKGCYFSRITGSGSACIGIFSNMKNAIYAKKLIKRKYPKYWCAVSKTI